MADQFIRKVSLIVGNPDQQVPYAAGSGPGLDLSELRIKFQVNQSDFETPNTTSIRVYNLANSTAVKIHKEFKRVVLQAGYRDGAFGIIFDGTIKQTRLGRETQTETYLDIFASDADENYNFGAISQSIAGGTTPEEQTKIIANAMNLETGYVNYDIGLNKNIRGKTLYGMGRAEIRNLARSGQAQWSIQNGKVNVIRLSSYIDGQAVVLNSRSGMIGLPEQTEDGISVRCLLNPKIIPGTQVQIDEASIQRAAISLSIRGDDPRQVEEFFPQATADGFYVVLVAEHEGDTRGNEFYTSLTCLSIDKTSPQDNSVKKYG